jgi:hypothetical protein
MPRFHLGQKVLITGPIATKDRGREATVISIQRNTETQPDVNAADKYIVHFQEGDEADFYEIQLAKVPEEEAKDT